MMDIFLTQPKTHLQILQMMGGAALFWLLVVSAAMSSPAQAREKMRIFIYGDSLSAGYGLKAQDGFAAQLKRALTAKQIKADIYNASQSGETSAGGLARLKWSLQGVEEGKPDIAILELGANDALRALDPAKTRTNLDRILTQLKARGITVLLAGMLAPPNLGGVYQKKFNGLYLELAKKHQVVFYPFFLAGVAGDKRLNLSDGKHPNAQGVRRIIIGILPFVEEAIKKARTNNRK